MATQEDIKMLIIIYRFNTVHLEALVINETTHTVLKQTETNHNAGHGDDKYKRHKQRPKSNKYQY